MTVQVFHSCGADFFFRKQDEDFPLDQALRKNKKPLVVWAHGWGQTHQAFASVMQPFLAQADHISLDFPGFGRSPPPPEHWGTEDYAEAVAKWLKDNNTQPVIWVGHSFGCRVGLRLAAHYPDRIKALCLIAGAGLKRKRPLHKKIYFYLRIKLFKLLKKFVPAGDFKDKLMSKFGSADYKNAGVMRSVFIRTVNEDQTETAKKITCPVTLIYGKNDTETPPEFGERFSRLIPGAELFLLDGQDHYSVLQGGRHQVIKILDKIIR